MRAFESHRERFLPYPELIEKRGAGDCAPYLIVDSVETSGRELAGAVDKVARRLAVPLDPDGRGVVLHEYGHVLYSPLVPPKVAFDPRVAAAVEDARVNLALCATGLPVQLGETGELYVSWLLALDAKRGDGFALFVRSVASIGTSVEPLLCAQLERLDPRTGAGVVLELVRRARDVLEKARIRYGRPDAPERSGRALARKLAELLRLHGLLDENGCSQSELVMDCSLKHAHHAVPEAEDEMRRLRNVREDVPDLAPGVMSVVRARLTRRLSARTGLRAWGSSVEGSVIRHAHRWSIDRKIFRRRGLRGRGTVLLDVSGSMRLDAPDLERLLRATGDGTRVAIYSGEGARGQLRIVADSGRRAEGDELTRYGSGNVIDLPALRWLSRQHAPRLWISDGKATGIGDQVSLRLRGRCHALARRYAIRRVDDIASAVKLLGGPPR